MDENFKIDENLLLKLVKFLYSEFFFAYLCIIFSKASILIPVINFLEQMSNPHKASTNLSF